MTEAADFRPTPTSFTGTQLSMQDQTSGQLSMEDLMFQGVVAPVADVWSGIVPEMVQADWVTSDIPDLPV